MRRPAGGRPGGRLGGRPGPLGSPQKPRPRQRRRGTRHSFYTQKIIVGHSERKVMEVTGHKTTAAFRRYGKLVTEALREIVEDTDSVRKLSAKEKPGL